MTPPAGTCIQRRHTALRGRVFEPTSLTWWGFLGGLGLVFSWPALPHSGRRRFAVLRWKCIEEDSEQTPATDVHVCELIGHACTVLWTAAHGRHACAAERPRTIAPSHPFRSVRQGQVSQTPQYVLSQFSF
jgi:hypothetical protein